MTVQSKNIVDKEGRQKHIQTRAEDVGRYVLLPGDPFRTDIIAQYFDNPVMVAHAREHKTWTGTLNGVKVSVCSTGMGCSSTAIAVEELIHCGADTIIRVGTCGRICEESQDRSLEGVVITGAVRDEGTTVQYVPIEYPAIADRHVTEALVRACKNRGYNFTEGIAQCKDSFYGQHDPDSMPNGELLRQRWTAWEKSRVMASEMECSALYVVSSIRGIRAGAVMAYGMNVEHSIHAGIDAVKLLIEQDRAEGRAME